MLDAAPGDVAGALDNIVYGYCSKRRGQSLPDRMAAPLPKI
jgi:hypothetical protein